MFRHPIYTLFGLAMLGLTGYTQYRGWSFLSYNEVRNVPKTVRDNPGVYRSHYAGVPHYFGGK